jgi:hypothetical protein
MTMREETEVLVEKHVPSTILSTTHYTWNALELNPDFNRDKVANTRLKDDAALWCAF